ncbi:GPI-anchored protein LLG1-like [Cucumis sativus]|uniref:GPI-anchored protein LLG1-like domain-containing protein n=1 Tax=Cucumis sativus TaxID=3659 RepID=A0A0A0K589_CUCSA|nr:GPI-anchored protein LLG1-like [Cucumis sativus]KGN44099.1 hypothetical protein Csa_015962 [Cucumis sativus]
MVSNCNWCFCTFCMLLLQLFEVSSTHSAFKSDEIFESHASTMGRRLLQIKKACPISFEFLNYTIITSKCKGPQYSPKLCCSALTQLVCPYVDALNDMTTDCASTIFSYINIYGKYPPGLFSSICREGAEGLACPPCPPPSHSKSASLLKRSSPSIVNASGLLLLLLSLV